MKRRLENLDRKTAERIFLLTSTVNAAPLWGRAAGELLLAGVDETLVYEDGAWSWTVELRIVLTPRLTVIGSGPIALAYGKGDWSIISAAKMVVEQPTPS